jgi:hypothetical protein
MIAGLPVYILLTFILTTVAALCLFYWTINNSTSGNIQKKSGTIIVCLIGWLIVQAVVTLGNVYNSDTASLPPKILLLGVLPPVLTIVYLFVTNRGRKFIDSLPLKHLTYLHMVRIPVEIVLFWLYQNQTIPKLMTFEGSNFDIIAGITAPFIAYVGLTKGKLSRKVILVWNLVCLGLLLNIVIHAILSAPSPLQTLAFDQPNIAILNFPFSWLPTLIVPLVLFTHLVSIRKLVCGKFT